MHLRHRGLGTRRKHRDHAGLSEAHQAMLAVEGRGVVLLRTPLLDDDLGVSKSSPPEFGYAMG